VPIQLAGITGPCPKCGNSITSPAAPAPPPVTPAFPTAAPVPQAPPDIHTPAPSAPPVLPPFPQAPSWSQTPSTPTGPPLDSPLPPRRPVTPEAASPSLLAGLPTTLPPNPAATPTPPASAPPLPKLGGEPSSSAEAGSLLAGFLNPQEKTLSQPGKPAEPEQAKPPTLPDAPAIPRLGEVDPDAKLTKRSRKPLPPIPGRPGKGSNLLRLGIAAVFIVSALAALLFAFKDPLTDLYYQHVAPLIVSTDETTPPPSDPTSEPSEPANASTPAPPVETIAKPEAPVETRPSPTPPTPEKTPELSTPSPAPAPPDAGPMTPEIVKPAVPALPGKLPTPPPPKTTLMEVPGGANGSTADAIISRPATSLGTVTNFPPEAKPAADALLAFLNGDTLEAKRKYILGAEDEQVNTHIERYYGQFPPAPVPITKLGFIRHDPNPEVGGGMQTVFMVASPDWKLPIPVMIQETKSGLKLDWIAFVEFKDNWLFKFVQAYHPTPGRFHVSIKRSHYFEHDVPDLENKDCFLIQPPQEDFEVAVFVDKKSPLAEMLRRELTWSTQYAYVLAEIQWREDGTNQWVELTDVPQINWYIYTDTESSDKK